MAKAFFGAILLLFAGVLWVTVPRGIKRPCPVCQGLGALPVEKPIMVGQGKHWVEQKEMLCPFCDAGRISLYDLRLHRTQMLRWMVKEQKLDPGALVKRTEGAWGKEGLDELHQSQFFMENPESKKQGLQGGK